MWNHLWRSSTCHFKPRSAESLNSQWVTGNSSWQTKGGFHWRPLVCSLSHYLPPQLCQWSILCQHTTSSAINAIIFFCFLNNERSVTSEMAFRIFDLGHHTTRTRIIRHPKLERDSSTEHEPLVGIVPFLCVSLRCTPVAVPQSAWYSNGSSSKCLVHRRHSIDRGSAIFEKQARTLLGHVNPLFFKFRILSNVLVIKLSDENKCHTLEGKKKAYKTGSSVYSIVLGWVVEIHKKSRRCKVFQNALVLHSLTAMHRVYRTNEAGTDRALT